VKSSLIIASTAMTLAASVGAFVAAAGVIATHATAAPAPANMKAYMIDVVAPAVKPVWDLSYADKISDPEWTQIQRASADLVASMAIISSGGKVPAEQTRAKSAVWQDWTKKTLAQATAAKTAADKKDQMALATAGDNLVETCGGCHLEFDPGAR
jgi:cytochrome c556